ncbi:VTC domain-domain-containing protein [Protomyces lactucae-debilis]|uniref:VTC domain-domain-containing protein n=1 Tax=Protomyces lactucae-debilis TaxID=2754530 RepID=A0A1Y2F5H1_PROLT|nr:VTC domain-containing protein [Protomyces lactucae-debilis]ORY78596.1 VTC domain-domain-containing protein [Protomyces lactucae-debilis]
MKFGQTLRDSKYSDWSYINYDALKALLKQDQSTEDWQESDESTFVEKLDAELEKVYSFQSNKYDALLEDVSKHEEALESLTEADTKPDDMRIKEFLKKLDELTEEGRELERYSRLNYSGFVKIVKKHDKLHTEYTVKPLLTVRLNACPFNKENYSPLLYRLSALYAGLRELAGEQPSQELTQSLPQSLGAYDNLGKESKASYKFWVHADNVMEVKTFILRRLPVLIFTAQDDQNLEPSGYQEDPTITQLYLDNPRFKMYLDKLEHRENAHAIFLQWHGNLKSKPTVTFTRETTTGEDDADFTSESFPIKEKYIKAFIGGEPVLDKQSKKQLHPTAFAATVKSVQQEIVDRGLEPVMRATFQRTAFQIPGDDSVKVTLDTNVALIREDAFDKDRPCRDPEDWHRNDIDEQGQMYPYKSINKGEINRFPFGLLEIKLKRRPGMQEPSWVEELSASHLVKPSPRFSKYAHGVASLFENHVNLLPFWLPDADKDIRRDPGQAYDEHEADSASSYPPKMIFTPSKSLESKSLMEAAKNARANAGASKQDGPSTKITRTNSAERSNQSDADGEERQGAPREAFVRSSVQRVKSFHKVLTGSATGSHRTTNFQLPPGVRKPGPLLKDSGPLKIEAKVWLANERTFIKWMHVAFLLTTVSLSLFNGARSTSGRTLGAVYALISVLMGMWGYYIYRKRGAMIRARSPEHFDSFLGPLIVCVALAVSLVVNFWWKYLEMKEVHGSAHAFFMQGGYAAAQSRTAF